MALPCKTNYFGFFPPFYFGLNIDQDCNFLSFLPNKTVTNQSLEAYNRISL